MSDQDRLAEIKARRAGVPDPALEVFVTPNEEEYYGQWRVIQYGPPDEYGDRKVLAFLGEEQAQEAEFVAHAPADIDWLIDQAELAFELGDLLPKKQLTIDRLRELLGRLERESLTCPVCDAVLHMGDPHGLDADRNPCWLAEFRNDESRPQPEG